ncbi:amidase [Mesorhizobium loti]|uniref:amidase n=1 Tax=Rhizobium loti TaxID=381 RepID=UPI00137839F2|nr:amidase [Mesorhizobium loti]
MTSPVGPWSPVTEIAQAVQQGRITAIEVIEAALERAVRVQTDLNCFAQIDASGARGVAADIDRRRAAGETLGLLAGVPVAIKDCTPVAGLGNRFGSHAFVHNIASRDAVIVERFRNADAVILGKTTLSEFASSSFCDSPLTGITRNPWNREHTAGGSSGGSAVAVATGCVAVAQGTDMGGSVRIPASCTGLIGIKPAAGRIPLDDQPSFVDDIQHHGLLTRSVADLAACLPLLCGPSRADPTTCIPGLPDLDTSKGVAGLKIALSDDLGIFLIEPEIRDRLDQAARHLEAAGAIVSRPLLNWDRSIADGWVRHWHVYLASFFGEALDAIGPLADPRLVEAVAKGRMHDAVSIRRLDLVRRRQWDALADVFCDSDVLLSPTMARPPVGVDEDDARYHAATPDGKKRGLDMTSVFNWVPWCPALSVPAGLSCDGLPIGLHVTAHPQREDIALRVAATIERFFPHQWPNGWSP